MQSASNRNEKIPTSLARSKTKAKTAGPRSRLGSQTLLRGLDVLEAVASGVNNLADLAATLTLNRSTAHRLAVSLVERRYLTFAPRDGYGLGPKSLELGYRARAQLKVPDVARKHLENLAAQTGNTVHLGVLDGTRAFYLDKIPGRRRVEISSRVGDLQPLRSTGLGKALLLDENDRQLRHFYRCEEDGEQHYEVAESSWMQRMHEYAQLGYAFDLEENEDRIRCVAAPVRDATGIIKAAISVSSAAQYMDDERMQALAQDVRWTAEQISRELGWEGPAASVRKIAPNTA
ncbi:MAG TPA: IclR family transcriptional regulator [Rhizomicrobium sp.]|jgi:DNA-binding IclR family transcriptional regulator|nr:IclR family transcriptional regulator [Rhizomicrobium sp.]